MMTPMLQPNRRLSPGRFRRGGFTLPEYLVTVAIVAFVSSGIIACCLFGGIICTFASTKLDYNDDIRGFIGDFVHYVRISTDLDVGSGNAKNFIPVADGVPRQGNALQVYTSTDTNVFIRFFLDTNDLCLKVLATDDPTNVTVLTDSITNKVPFTVEDIYGNIATNDTCSLVVGLLLQMNPPLIKNNPGGLKDYYQFTTRATRRIPLGYQQ
jgi:prepilin-type N-terminal cleavage/methylation domain-containing protein